MLVVIAGSELFTGNIMYMPFGILEGKASYLGLIRNWVGSWVFNLVGALFVAYFLAYLNRYSNRRSLGSNCSYHR